MVGAGFVFFFRYDRPLELIARAVEWVLTRLRRKRPPTTGVAAKLKAERDQMAKTFGDRWKPSSPRSASGRSTTSR